MLNVNTFTKGKKNIRNEKQLESSIAYETLITAPSHNLEKWERITIPSTLPAMVEELGEEEVEKLLGAQIHLNRGNVARAKMVAMNDPEKLAKKEKEEKSIIKRQAREQYISQPKFREVLKEMHPDIDFSDLD